MRERSAIKRIKQWFFRKIDGILRSNSYHRILKFVTIMVCLIVSAILALLLFLKSS